jgi:lysozyme
MDISQRGIDLIVSFEGKHKKLKDGRYQAYLDTLAKPPVWTLYCGLTRGISEGMICSEEEGQRMFRKELNIYEDAIERLVHVDLNQNQFDALTSFVYNCGIGALEKSTLLKLLNQGKYEAVPAQLMRWVNAGGKRYEGLVRRRKAEGALFAEPMPAAEAPPEGIEAPNMPQRVEEAPAGNVGALVRDSWTIRGVLIAGASYIADKAVGGYEWLFGVAKEAGPEILSLKTTISPFDPLVKLTPIVLTGLVVAGLAIVVSRRISARREGKEG